jgi:hypothetical protein
MLVAVKKFLVNTGIVIIVGPQVLFGLASSSAFSNDIPLSCAISAT